MSSGAFLLIMLLGATVAYFAYLALGQRWWETAGTLFTLAALITLSISLITRGTRGNHWPLANRFEFALCYLWAILAIYLLFKPTLDVPALGAFVLPFALLLSLWAARRPATELAIRPLAPALQSAWFPLHVVCSAISYGAFTIGGSLGVMHLTGNWLNRQGLIQAGAPTRFLAPERYEYLIWRAVGMGFPWLTMGMLAGAIWAQTTWARYWDWDPKETWTLITWLNYLILLHGRALRSWDGRRVAWLAVTGVVAVLFTFLGVDWLVEKLRLESVHIF